VATLRLIVNAGSWAGAWGTYWADSWGTSWGYDAGGEPIPVESAFRNAGGGPLGRSTRKSGGPWQSLDQIKDTALTWDRDEDVLLLIM
jgi:hypothetical protein